VLFVYLWFKKNEPQRHEGHKEKMTLLIPPGNLLRRDPLPFMGHAVDGNKDGDIVIIIECEFARGITLAKQNLECSHHSWVSGAQRIPVHRPCARRESASRHGPVGVESENGWIRRVAPGADQALLNSSERTVDVPVYCEADCQRQTEQRDDDDPASSAPRPGTFIDPLWIGRRPCHAGEASFVVLFVPLWFRTNQPKRHDGHDVLPRG